MKPIQLITSAERVEQFPQATSSEIAFWAESSEERQRFSACLFTSGFSDIETSIPRIHFYKLTDRVTIADLPALRQTNNAYSSRGGELIEAYLNAQRPLSHLIYIKNILSDWNPLSDSTPDLGAPPTICVLTGVDAVDEALRKRRVRESDQRMGAVFCLSIKTGGGLKALEKEIFGNLGI